MCNITENIVCILPAYCIILCYIEEYEVLLQTSLICMMQKKNQNEKHGQICQSLIFYNFQIVYKGKYFLLKSNEGIWSNPPKNIFFWWHDVSHSTEASWNVQCGSQILFWLIVLCAFAWLDFALVCLFFPPSKHTLLANRIPAAVLI